MDPVVPVHCPACPAGAPGTATSGICTSCQAIFEPAARATARRVLRSLPAFAPLQ